jgi:glycosyltransferase involved in cell wall biosynthesis
MAANPLFTIITSTLNSGLSLERCLLSVEAQSFPEFEHLIVDGASRDNTLSLVKHYQSRYPLRLVCSQIDTGIYQAWNRGVEQAKGEWILFLGSDDYLNSTDILAQVAAEIHANSALSSLSFLYGDTISADEPSDWATYKPNAFIQWLRGVTEFPTSVFINAELFRQGHRFDESYRICGDDKFFAQHSLHNHSWYLPITVISFHKGGISSNPANSRMHYRERRRMLKELHRSRPLFTEIYYWLRSHHCTANLLSLVFLLWL